MIEYNFEFKNESGNSYGMSAAVKLYPNIGYDEMEVLEAAINDFMRIIGYSFPNDYIFLESLTADELEKVSDFLIKLRDKEKNKTSKNE